MMREEMLDLQTDWENRDGLKVELGELERRYQGAKAVLIAAAGESVLPEAAAEFVSARDALRLVLEEIWPEPNSLRGH